MSAAERLAAIHDRIATACAASGRGAGEVRLLAVSKTFPTEALRELYDAGQRLFGENRQQEAAGKMPNLPQDIEWHFIGGLQRNKVRKVVESFHTIHSISSLRLAEAANRVAGELGRIVPVYLEVNVGGEESKGGFTAEELLASAGELAAFTHLKLEGLMAIPPEDDEPRRWFAQTRELRDRLEKETGLSLPGLSMGMSADFPEAIREGATVVRVGSALLGKRDYA